MARTHPRHKHDRAGSGTTVPHRRRTPPWGADVGNRRLAPSLNGSRARCATEVVRGSRASPRAVHPGTASPGHRTRLPAPYSDVGETGRLAASPLMDLRLLLRRPVATGTLLILVATALMITVFFLGSFYLQDHRGYGALQTGLLFLPVALATMLGANAAGRVIGRTGPRTLAVLGLLLAAAGFVIPALWCGTVAMVSGVSLAAAGTGAVFVVASATALAQIDPREAGLASGIVSTFHEFGASLGAAVVSSVAAASIAGNSTDGFSRGFTTGAIIAAAAAGLAFIITPRPRSSN
ncbi:MFS transporter [Micromonospora sp. NBC_00389]|uniref:MFS transporter n=1 Tax=Micromonospora sp. NBC_00389 TaxID=2903586 RepID=UPI002E226E34